MRILSKIIDVLSKYGWSATLVFLAAVALGFTWSTSDEIFTSIRLFDRIALMVDQNYVESVDRTKLIKAGVDGMLEKLDKYTKYLDGGDFLHLQQATDGKIDGIGVYLEYHRDTLTVTSVLDGTPGQRAGITAGDRILMIDSVATMGLEIREVRMLMSGETGTPIVLLVSRPDDGDYSITAYREEVNIKSIPFSSMISDDIGFIKLARFSERCTINMKKEIMSLQKKGMRSLILDLRGNPGGLLGEAIETASLFLPDNVAVVETRGRDGLRIASYTAYGDPVFLDGELAILIDRRTASAAEIVAGAIQDHDRGVIIGGSSYGKGLVQQVLMVSDESALKITTSRYHLPSGRCLQKPGWSEFGLLPQGEGYDRSDSIFYTAQGRPVFGGGGITPDIYIDNESESGYVEALIEESYFFDFVTEFLKENEITPEFKIDDKMLKEFRRFIEEKNFRYDKDERTAFNDLKDNLAFVDRQTKKAMATLNKKISGREKWYFESNYKIVAEELAKNIIIREFGEKIWYEIDIPEQPHVSRALEILSNNREYSAVFNPR
ncbi:MAG: S41 family peptidase [candidate division Zixibacteria bacterium]